MPNYTTKYLFPSPKPTESADGPTGFQQLAQKVEDVLTAEFAAQIAALTTRITNVETKNTAQDTRLTNIETKNTAQDTRLTNVESKNTSQDTTINAINARTADSGNDALVVSYASGWKASTIYGNEFRRFGAFAWIRFAAVRTGGAIAAGTAGNIADTLMATITSSQQPAFNANKYGGAVEGGGGVFGEVNENGQIIIQALAPGDTVATNDEIRLTAMYVM